jgi:hypothetical protein
MGAGERWKKSGPVSTDERGATHERRESTLSGGWTSAHLSRDALREAGAVRFCEHCGKAWVMQELRDLLSNPLVYQWTEIEEPEQNADER